MNSYIYIWIGNWEPVLQPYSIYNDSHIHKRFKGFRSKDDCLETNEEAEPRWVNSTRQRPWKGNSTTEGRLRVSNREVEAGQGFFRKEVQTRELPTDLTSN